MKPPFLLLAAATLLCVGADYAQAKPFAYAYKSKYARVEFSWSSEAAAVPALVKRFRAALTKEKAEAISCGKLETSVRVKLGAGAVQCESSTKFTTSGESVGLLSLSRTYWAFTGGAHGNGSTTGLLWDRRFGKEISFSSLFSQANGYSQPLRASYCRALDKERKKRRWSGYQPGAVPEFDACPNFSELALIPADSNRNHRFDRVHVIAAPYVAGSFAEGEYDVALPVTAALIAALKPEYRSSFERQRQ
jgi:hypothetical protein